MPKSFDISLAKQPSVTICRVYCGNVQERVAIHVLPLQSLYLPVFRRILDDTEAINPDVLQLNFLANNDGVLESLCKLGEGDALLKGSQVITLKTLQDRLTPAVAQSSVLRIDREGILVTQADRLCFGIYTEEACWPVVWLW
jgi:hypothetical protein